MARDAGVGDDALTAVPSREALLAEIKALRYKMRELEGEKADLELLLETNTEHSDNIERELQRAKEEAEAANQAKSSFLSSVSHELRTPLTSVLGFAKIIQKSLNDKIFPNVQTDDRKTQRAMKSVAENIDIIVAEGKRLTTLINDVLDLAKIESGKMDWNMQPLNIQEVIERSIAATSTLFEQKSIPLLRDYSDNLPEVMGDRDKLIQVVINLLSNAVKFTPDGSVTCKAEVLEHNIVVSVIDEGIGIASEDQSKVFEKFKQVGDTLTDKPQGTGLGLPICKEIVTHHQGELWLRSSPGVGSTFSFSIPLSSEAGAQAAEELSSMRIAELPELTTLDADTLVAQLKPHLTANGGGMESPAKNSILVVDDDKNIRQLLRQELEAEGYRVYEAQDGNEAIAKVKSVRPDLIILDVMMPELSGFDVAAVLKNDPKRMDIPIVILSIVEDARRGYRLGVDRYMTKPIDTPALLKEIETLLRQPPSKKNVLLVDENASTVQTLAKVLQAKGYGVVEAYDDESMIEKALVSNPDMIIVNAMLAEKRDLVKLLRFEKGLDNVSILLYR